MPWIFGVLAVLLAFIGAVVASRALDIGMLTFGFGPATPRSIQRWMVIPGELVSLFAVSVLSDSENVAGMSCVQQL